MREHESEFSQKGARIAAIGLGDGNYGRLFREEAGITFPLLIDEERVAYRVAELGVGTLFQVLRSDNMAARRSAKKNGHRQHKLGKNPFQLGGSFVFAPDNRDHYAHVSKTFGDNASISELLAAIPS